jgi:hypothetical protein
MEAAVTAKSGIRSDLSYKLETLPTPFWTAIDKSSKKKHQLHSGFPNNNFMKHPDFSFTQELLLVACDGSRLT